MPVEERTKSLASDFPGGLDEEAIKTYINVNTTITTECLSVERNADEVTFTFLDALSSEEVTAFDEVVVAYVHVVYM